ncbi:MAG: Rieske 2Fe-2S domain-containing protein [Acidiferrobacterales bacterium]|nr:Rieske 2Fe-2S domain-containing protein [Acidiferrobacterales bacterium]
MTKVEKCNRVICDSSRLESEGTGYRFVVDRDGETLETFVLRYRGKVYSYLNRCPHLFLSMDYEEGEFFDLSADYIVCSNHGALFEPDSGECVSGPCFGASLEPIQVVESDGLVMIDDDCHTLVEDR